MKRNAAIVFLVVLASTAGMPIAVAAEDSLAGISIGMPFPNAQAALISAGFIETAPGPNGPLLYVRGEYKPDELAVRQSSCTSLDLAGALALHDADGCLRAAENDQPPGAECISLATAPVRPTGSKEVVNKVTQIIYVRTASGGQPRVISARPDACRKVVERRAAAQKP